MIIPIAAKIAFSSFALPITRQSKTSRVTEHHLSCSTPVNRPRASLNFETERSDYEKAN
jgi:hypothetical protein